MFRKKFTVIGFYISAERGSIMSKTDILEETDGIEKAHSLPSDMHSYLLDYVNENFCNSALCLNAVADHMNASIYAVSRAFKERTGVGFKEYITGKRLEYACTLLQTTDHTIWEIATQCGFENATYFTTVFRRKFCMPPSRYRMCIQRTEKEK